MLVISLWFCRVCLCIISDCDSHKVKTALDWSLGVVVSVFTWIICILIRINHNQHLVSGVTARLDASPCSYSKWPEWRCKASTKPWLWHLHSKQGMSLYSNRMISVRDIEIFDILLWLSKGWESSTCWFCSCGIFLSDKFSCWIPSVPCTRNIVMLCWISLIYLHVIFAVSSRI